MSDRPTDQPPGDAGDMLARWVRRAADSVPTAPVEDSLRDVERAAIARRRRHRVGVPLAAAALVGIGAMAVVVNAGSSSDTVMTPTDTGTPSVVPTTTVPPTTVPGTDPQSVSVEIDDSTAPTSLPVDIDIEPQLLTTFDREPVPIAAPPEMEQFDYRARVLPFRDGFAATRPTFIGTPGFPLTVQEAQILLGIDLAILIEESGATTEAEAIDAATQAGRIDDVNAALAEEPRVLDALLNHKWTPGLDVFLTDDGMTWTSTVLELPVERGLITDVASDGEHLVVAVTDDWPDLGGEYRDLDVTVMITADLETFETHEWTVPDPRRELTGPLWSAPQTRLVAAPGGWALGVHPMTDLDSTLVVADLVGADRAGMSMAMSDDSVVVDVERSDGSVDRFELTWPELGVDAATKAVIRGPEPLTVWSAPWGGEPSSRSIDGHPLGSLAATSSGYLTAAGDRITFGDISGATTTISVPPGRQASTAIATDGGALVELRDIDYRPSLWEVDRQAQTWTPIEFDRIPAGNGLGLAQGAQWPVEGWEQPIVEVVPSTSTWVQGDFVYTWERFRGGWSYEVRTLDGELVVAEDPEQVDDTLPESLFDHLRTGLAGTTITDPATGEVIVNLSPAETRQMEEAATRVDGSPLPDYDFDNPTMWLLAETANSQWFMHRFGERSLIPDSGGSAAAMNGNTILAARQGEWLRFDV
ncbi:MAG: hypothetical protein AAGG08_08745 [Actinomycetota bacterium]